MNGHGLGFGSSGIEVSGFEVRILTFRVLRLQFVILELTPVADIDTTGINALEELLRALAARGIKVSGNKTHVRVTPVSELKEEVKVGK